MYKITVVIPTYGRSDLLKRTLSSLSNCIFPDEYISTIVIENGPKGEAEEVCAGFSGINCIYKYSPEANKSAALNKAMKEIKDNSYIIFFDDDVRIEPQVLSVYTEAFSNEGKNYFYGGPFGVDYQKKPPDWYFQFLPLSAQGWQNTDEKSLGPYDLIGFNWGIHIDHLRNLGGFDTKFGPNSTTGATGQEHDMMFRLYEAGIKPKYVKEAKVWHFVPKERSTFSWALKRRYKAGLSEGLRSDKDKFKKINLFIKEERKALVKSVLLFSRSAALISLFKIAHLEGIKKSLTL